MTATVTEGQADLLRLIELASHGEDVIITVDGRPKAKLTRADAILDNGMRLNSAELAAWLTDLDRLRKQYETGCTGSTVDQILAEDRADRL